MSAQPPPFIEWSYLRPALLRLIALVLLSLLLLGALYFLARNSEKKAAERAGALQAAKQTYVSILRAEQIMTEFQPPFSSLRDRGMIDFERRLDWIEQLQLHSRRLLLPGLTYELEARRPMHLPNWPDNRVALSVSPMKLGMQLYHEGDLLSLLSGLREEAPGLFWLRECTLTRAAPASDHVVATPEHDAGLVEATCELLWLTVNMQQQGE